MNTNTRMKKQIEAEVKLELGDSECGIEVAVDDGAVMLTGTAPTYMDKCAAERAARRVPGVRAVSEGIRVTTEVHESADDAIAKAVAQALDQEPNIPAGIQATVEGGWVTLRGEVASAAERDAALEAIQRRAHVNRVYNLITLKPAEMSQRASVSNVSQRTSAA